MENPSDRLRYYNEKLIQPRVKSETEAQSYAAFQLPRFARENPGLNINSQEEFNRPWFKNYPASYATKGIDHFYKIETQSGQRRVVPSETKDAVAAVEYKPNVAYNALKLGLDSELREEEKSILDRTQEFIDQRLNPYQTEKTEREQNYFKQ